MISGDTSSEISTMEHSYWYMTKISGIGHEGWFVQNKDVFYKIKFYENWDPGMDPELFLGMIPESVYG